MPGGPCRATPRGMRAPTRRKRSGSLRKTTTSRSSSTASSQPATSAKRVAGGVTWAVRRMRPWPPAAERPPGPTPRPPPLRPRMSSMPPTTNSATRAKPSGSSSVRIVPLRPEPDPDEAGAGLRTATPSPRRCAARSKAPGRRLAVFPAFPATAPGVVAWAKSRPGLGLRDLRRDDLAAAVDGGHPVARGVDHGRVQVARVGRPDQLAVGHDRRGLGAERLDDGRGDLGGLVRRERGRGEGQGRHQRQEHGEEGSGPGVGPRGAALDRARGASTAWGPGRTSTNQVIAPSRR